MKGMIGRRTARNAPCVVRQGKSSTIGAKTAIAVRRVSQLVRMPIVGMVALARLVERSEMKVMTFQKPASLVRAVVLLTQFGGICSI